MKKRILSMLMCIAMLLSSVLFLASCKKDGDDGSEVSGKVIDVDLTDYYILSGVELSEEGNQHTLDFAKALSKLTALDVSVVTDTDEEVVKNKNREILIGETSREESTKTLNDIKGTGWAIRVFDNKIAIVGTTPYLTRVALSYFEQNYLNAEHVNGVTLSVNQKIENSNMSTFSLVEDVDGFSTAFTLVYGNGMENYAGSKTVAGTLGAVINQESDVNVEIVDSKEAEKEQPPREILIGPMDRIDVKEELSKIDADEYAVAIRDNRIYVLAWTADVLLKACSLFEDMLYSSSYVDEDDNTVFEIPSGSMVVQAASNNWFTDFPKPEATGLYPEIAVDAYGGNLQYIYAGSGATRETFVAYCETLKAAGYTPMGNEDVQWEGSSFRTFLHEEKGVSLHVSHMAFSHAADQNLKSYADRNSIRIVSGYTDQMGGLVDAKYFRPQVAGTEEQVKNGEADYVWRMNSRITSNLITHSATNWGTGQIITLSDGSFIIIDGGRSYVGDDTPNVWGLLKELHKEAYGSYPNKDHPVHIRAWIISHEHGDHHNVLANFVNHGYAGRHDVRFDYLMQNFGSKLQLRDGGTQTIRSSLKTYLERAGCEFVEVKSGQVLYFANCRLEILATIDDLYPALCSEQNNASVVVRTALVESDSQGNSHETTSLWVGDAEGQVAANMRAMYGDFLKSDQVSIAHHGNNDGGDKELYTLVESEVIWMTGPASQNMLDNFMKDGNRFGPAFKNPNCKILIFNASTYAEHEKYNTTLIISATGPLYDKLYDAASGPIDGPIDAKGCDDSGKPICWPVVDVQEYLKASGYRQ